MRKLRVKLILFTISRFYGFSIKGIKKHDRTTDKVQARRVFCYVCRELGYTFGESAKVLDMDRNNSRHSVEVIEDTLKAVYNHPDDQHIPEDVEYLINKCKRWRKIRR